RRILRGHGSRCPTPAVPQSPTFGANPGITLAVDPARRLSCELPQGRKAARVNGLCRVRGVPYVWGRLCARPVIQRWTAKGPPSSMVSFDSLSPDELAALHARHEQE